MEQFLAILLVAVVAAAFYGVSHFRKNKMYPACDRFATAYCELADRLLDGVDTKEDVLTETLDGGLLRILPVSQQPEAIQIALQKPIDDSVMASVRELFFLRDDIQAQASNGSFAKDRYNAITNQVFNSLNTYLSILQNPAQVISQKDLDYFYYFFQKQMYIRNTTFAAIVSKACAKRISIV